MENCSISLETIYSQDNRPSEKIRKIDGNGTFELFDGITIVCDLVSDVSSFYERLTKVLPPDCFSILPKESFHMTIASIQNRNRFPTLEKYNEYLKNNLENFIQIKSKYSKISSETQFEMLVKPFKSGLFTKRVLGVELIGTNEVDKILKEWQLIAVQPLKLQRTFPTWHLTLAYPTKRELNKSESKDLFDLLNQELFEKELKFGVPRLCYFHGMTKFISM